MGNSDDRAHPVSFGRSRRNHQCGAGADVPRPRHGGLGRGPARFRASLRPKAAACGGRGIRLASPRGIWTGPLGGVPISIKDLFDIRGLPTTAGSAVLADAAPAPGERGRGGAAAIGRRGDCRTHEHDGVRFFRPRPQSPLWDSGEPVRSAGAPHSRWFVIRRRDFDHGRNGGGGDRTTDTGGCVHIPPALCGIVRLQADRSAYPARGRAAAIEVPRLVGPLATV